MIRRAHLAALLALAGGLFASVAHAGKVYWSVGIQAPMVGTVISNAPAYPAPVYAPVYGPAYGAVYAPAPVIYVPPPVVRYRPPPQYVVPYPAHRHWHGRGHGDGRDRWHHHHHRRDRR
ncbi:hypothetical protein V4F39_20025 [Aquincola sp. MAHUQ-54]|uniref:PXPV repeat-containing protein n=1 Tax=Aquincola agrisoli TaxID=3119538 RepID=A0AAW9Q8A0_9BURK